MKRSITVITLAATLGLLAAGSLQAYGPGWGHGAGMMMHPGYAGYGAAQGLGPCAQGRVQDVGALKTALGITAEQESAWQRYAEAVAQRTATRTEHREQIAEALQTGGLTAQERLELRSRFLEDRLEVHQAYADAVRDLYGVLTPAQQSEAERILPHGRMF